MTHLVIGVGGLLTAGKDVFADHLVEKHGFVKLGMSDVLREATEQFSTVFLREDDDSGFVNMRDLLVHYGYVEAKKRAGYRTFLQELGTEVGRNLLGENIWVDAAKKKILAQVVAGKDVVITGIRFPNELDMITKVGWADTFEYPSVSGTTVWIERPGLPAPVGAHASEATLSREDFEYTAWNEGTIADLEAAADVLLEEIRDDFVAGEKDLFTNRSAGEIFEAGRAIVDEDHRARGESPEPWNIRAHD